MSPESLTHIGRNLLNRKTFLNKTTGSLGFLGLSHLLNQNAYSEVINTENFSGKDPIRPFIDSKDPRYIKTVKAIEKNLCYNGLLYRYKNEDDFGLPSSSFTICTFWFINSLYKIGEIEKSKKMLDQIIKHGNHLNLFSEDLDFESKRLLGNFPQAYSHLALIDAALNFN